MRDRASWAAVATASWSVAFAAVHLFWAFGGSTGLATSAGRDLARRRPIGFMIFGLYGVAALLLIGAVVACVAVAPGTTDAVRRILVVLTAVVALVLIFRGVAVELALATDLGGVRTQVGANQTRWSLALWNPWFALGGALFGWTALAARRRPELSSAGLRGR